MTHFFLIRHGETDWNLEGRLQGQTDIPLNARGLQQAHGAAQALLAYAPTHLVTSDLLRAQQTARIIAAAAGLALHTDPRLREVRLGAWEGRLAADLSTAGDERFAQRRRYPAAVAPPGGETAAQVRQRLLDALHEVAAAHPGGRVVVVTHGFAVAVLLSVFRNLPLEQVWDLIPTNAEIHTVEIPPHTQPGLPGLNARPSPPAKTDLQD